MPDSSYLAATDIIDWQTPAVRQLAAELAEVDSDPIAIARRSFEWVRDEIKHSSDYKLNPVTCKASEVLAAFTPPVEQLAFAIEFEGECNLPDMFAEPLPAVVNVLHTHATWDAVLANLPYAEPNA